MKDISEYVIINPLTNEDIIENRNNISPKIWGPNFWRTFHTVLESSPEYISNEVLNHYIKFIKYFFITLPCETCATDAVFYFKGNQPAGIKTRTELIKWGIDFHNHVNRKLGKKIFEGKYDLYTEHEKPYNKCNTFIYLCIILFLVIAIIYLVVVKN